MNTSTIPQTAEVDEVTISKNVDGKIIIKDGGVDTAQLADDAIATAKVQDDAISAAKQTIIKRINEPNHIKLLQYFGTFPFVDFSSSGYYTVSDEGYLHLINATGNIEGFKSTQTFQKQAGKKITITFQLKKTGDVNDNNNTGFMNATPNKILTLLLQKTNSIYCTLYCLGAGSTVGISDITIASIIGVWTDFKIIFENASAKLYINDVLKVTNTTNLPTEVLLCAGIGKDSTDQKIKNINCIKEDV